MAGYSLRRIQLIHQPTGARLDLVDSHRSGLDLARRTFERETRWHDQDGRTPLWKRDDLTAEEAAHADVWAYTDSTPLRSALLLRSMPLWYRYDISPAWATGRATRPHRLTWYSRQEAGGHDEIVALLTRSAARIPGARYRPNTPSTGSLELGDSHVVLASI